MGVRALVLIVGLLASTPAAAQSWPWRTAAGSTTVAARIAPPAGFTRLPLAPQSFGAWLRALPVRAGQPAVHLFDGRLKRNQEAQAYVLDVDTGSVDLQQCADAVMRLFAEYQWASGARDDICFRFTSGDRAAWSAWSAGQRPVVRGSKVRWSKSAGRSDTYRTFRDYLDTVFTYAGTHSLAKDLRPVTDPTRVEPGDVFIRGGFPGHAVLVVDVAEDGRGNRVFLLAQSFMPAQEPHILRVPDTREVWYPARATGVLETPEWTFERSDLRRFGPSGCP